MFKYLSIYVIILSAGCASYQLWENETYTENISEYLLAQDGSTLIVVGRQYHYVFPEPKGITKILLSEHSKEFNAEFGERFTVTRENDISGTFKIACNCPDASENLSQFLEEHKFKVTNVKTSCGYSTKKYFQEFALNGKRYAAKEENSSVSTGFNRAYNVVIELEAPASETAKKIALTPLAVTIDTVNITAVAVIGAVFLPLTIIKVAIDPPGIGTSAHSCDS